MTPKHHLSLDDDIRAIIAQSDITENKLTLPDKMLDRPLFERLKKALTLAGGKWTGKVGKGGHYAFQKDPREIFGLAVETGLIKDVKKATQAFYTPTELARRVIERAGVDGMTVLEPSAGHGALAEAARDGGALSVACIEVDPDSVATLLLKGFSAIHYDFTKITTKGGYQRIVMNPPFTGGQDIDHVTHAFQSFLIPGGRLVAIMSPGWRTKQDKRSTRFQDLVMKNGYIAEEIAPGAFKESGTKIATLMVVLNKPE